MKIFICYIKLLLALAAWSSLFYVLKPLIKEVNLETVAFLRYILTTITLLIILKIKNGTFKANFNVIQWGIVISMGIIGICLYNIFFLNAESLIPGSSIAVFYAFAPVLTTILSTYLFKIKLHNISKLGIIISLLGTIEVVNYATESCQQIFCKNILNEVGKGEIYSILAVIAFSCYSILGKYASKKSIPALTLNTYTSLIGCIGLGALSFNKLNLNQVYNLNHSFWLILCYLSIFATVVSYLWYTEAIFKIGVVKTVVLQNTLPLQGLLIGYIFFNEHINNLEIIYGLIVLIGVYLTNYGCILISRQTFQT